MDLNILPRPIYKTIKAVIFYATEK